MLVSYHLPDSSLPIPVDWSAREVTYQRCLAELSHHHRLPQQDPASPARGSADAIQSATGNLAVSYATSSFSIPITNAELTHTSGEKAGTHPYRGPTVCLALPRRHLTEPIHCLGGGFPLPVDSMSQTRNPICARLPRPAISNRHQFHLPDSSWFHS